jgi:protein-serine/threonine kinase
VGKLGSPGWANAIKAFIRNQTHLRAVARLAEGYGFGMGIADNGSTSDHPGGLKVTPPLRVVNGMSTPTATTSPTSAGSATSGPLPPSPTDTVQPGRSEPGSPGTIRIAPPLPSPPVGAYSEAATSGTSSSTAPLTINSDSRAWLRSAAGRNLLSGIPLQPEATIIPSYPSAPSGQTQSTIPQSPKEEVAYPRKPIKPSLTTLDRAISAKIYFENLYFPLLRLPPPREVRRLALEKDLASPLLKLSEEEKEMVRQRWKQNETEYLRERRMRVGPEAFKRVKIIGHGAFGVVSLVRERESGKLYAMKQVAY